MTDREKGIWQEGFEEGRKQGRFDTRHEEFIQPLLRYILMGFMVALGIIFGIGAIAFMIVCFANLLIGLIGLFISGSLCGIAWAVFIYFLKEY